MNVYGSMWHVHTIFCMLAHTLCDAALALVKQTQPQLVRELPGDWQGDPSEINVEAVMDHGWNRVPLKMQVSGKALAVTLQAGQIVKNKKSPRQQVLVPFGGWRERHYEFEDIPSQRPVKAVKASCEGPPSIVAMTLLFESMHADRAYKNTCKMDPHYRNQSRSHVKHTLFESMHDTMRTVVDWNLQSQHVIASTRFVEVVTQAIAAIKGREQVSEKKRQRVHFEQEVMDWRGEDVPCARALSLFRRCQLAFWLPWEHYHLCGKGVTFCCEA
jgi:hypothetical protein